MLALNLADEPLPEGERLGVRVVDAEDRDAVADPEQQDVATRVPERLPVVAPEVERVDVLVLLRRILRVLDRSVGADVEPVVMLLHPGMIGRALQRVVERDLEAESARRVHEPIEVGERAEGRVDRRVSALFIADRPRTADVVRSGVERVVLSLCGRCGRSGGSAADRRRRIQAPRDAAVAPPRRRRCRDAAAAPGTSVVCERGNSSYHAAARARSRSTTIVRSRAESASGRWDAHAPA